MQIIAMTEELDKIKLSHASLEEDVNKKNIEN